ncbi:MAG: hypothetical protein CML12_00755 [Puniceicoccaceae bacterium]|nr:hypothetical protein [Puniceicoccaceae bacterium]RCL30803.1 MAG: hypothetical protein DBX03_01710 [Puniceicoccaceae bacterium]
MFTCKQVSDSLNKAHFHSLPKWKQCMIKLHVKFCTFCGKYNTQVIENHEMCQHFRQNESKVNDTRFSEETLNESNKSALKAKIQEIIESK